jgi:hypothetical protein
MDNMERINEEILQQRQEEYTAEDYQREIVRLRAQLSASQQGEKLALEQLVAQQSHVAPSSSQMMPQSLQQQQYGVTAPMLRKRLPDISKFDGSRKGYPMWKVEADNKLRIDGAVLGTPQDQAAYLFSRMEAKAQLMVVSFYQNQLGCDAATFVQHLDSVYIDPNAAARALNRLQAMKQGKESFATFLPKFEKELGESQLTMVPDMVKIGYLRGALNSEMQRAMIGPVTYIDYGTFVQALLAVGSQLDCLQYQKGRATPMATTSRTWPEGDAMDWTPTIQVGKLQRRLTFKEQQRCRQEGRCFLCLKRGHRANDCSSKEGDGDEKKKKDSVDKLTKVRAVQKKSNVVIEEIKEVESSDSDVESENE